MHSTVFTEFGRADLDQPQDGERLSHERGPTASVLLEETLGANLRGTTDRFGDRDALVVIHQGKRATRSSSRRTGMPSWPRARVYPIVS